MATVTLTSATSPEHGSHTSPDLGTAETRPPDGFQRRIVASDETTAGFENKTRLAGALARRFTLSQNGYGVRDILQISGTRLAQFPGLRHREMRNL